MSQRRKGPREKDLTSRYASGDIDEDRIESSQRFSSRSKHAEQNKILRTSVQRAHDAAEEVDLATLPTGIVVQVFSLYCIVLQGETKFLCVVRKTLQRVSETGIVVGDEVRFRPIADNEDAPRPQSQSPDCPEAVIEEVLPRRTVLTRADSFKGLEQHPIVANAEQMLIVVGLAQPRAKWGLVDRMIVAAQSGGLVPIVCLNKTDLANTQTRGADIDLANEVMDYYEKKLSLRVLRTSAETKTGLDAVCELLKNKVTVLAGHSGVGKSTLVNAIQPHLKLRTGEVSHYTEKGRHTTTSAVRYVLDFGGAVIDTPGVKLFGLWNITHQTLIQFFPDIQSGQAPSWRIESCERIIESCQPH